MSQKQETSIDQLLAYAADNGLQVVEARDIAHGRQVRLTNGAETVVVNVYQTGKMVIGGKKTPLKAQLEAWKNLVQAAGGDDEGESASRKGVYRAHIGVDEAGKGDYFGPLVAAAVYVAADAAPALSRWGVRDSKSMSDTTIAALAFKIRARCPHAVDVLRPPDYNRAYARHQNLNHLLAERHALVIDQMVAQTGCRAVLVDQFAPPEVLAQALAQRGLALDLSQRPHGETDVAVAAASILARQSFVAAVEDYRVKTGLPIPLGASAPEVVEIGQEIVRRWGAAGLARIAKMNFRTTGKVLERMR